ncbi:MAG: protein kinase [Deltaproteobacteria bacterium]|nr:protein kinase [Deltaproteobacteria bacterium]
MGAVRRLGRYLLVEPLARGGMGEVWLARPEDVPGAPPLCVVKTLREGLVADAEARTRFVDESRVALLLSHPCVCRTVDAGSVGDTLFIALEVVEGLDVRLLAARAAEAGHPIDEDLALWIVGCAADGLAFAHQARHPLTGAPLGIVHRDISPHNLMCAVDGTVKIIDFGLALSSMKEAQTERDVVLGKLSYMSPEQATGRALDERSDVFALGVVLYELLTGERYWGSLKHDQIWLRAGAGTYVPSGVQRLAPDLRAVVGAAIAPRVDERTATAGALRDQIARVLGARGGAVDAAARLGELVTELAQPELARIETARTGSDTLPPDVSSPVMSIALEEVRAIEALLAREQPPSPTITMAPSTIPELAMAETVRRTSAPSGPPEPPAATERVRAPAHHGAPASSSTATERVAPRRSLAPAVAIATAAALVAVLALVVVLLPTSAAVVGVVDAGPVVAPPRDAPPSTPVVVERPPVEPAPAPPVVAERVLDAGAGNDVGKRPPAPPRLSALLRKLERCDDPCAHTLRSTTRDVDRLSGTRERDVRALITQCLARCGQAR